METELNHIARLLDEMASLGASNPDLVCSRKFFEMWENTCNPRPFPVKSAKLTFGDRTLSLPKKDRYLVYLTWNPETPGPELIAENHRSRHRYAVECQQNEITFRELKPGPKHRTPDNPGEIMEVMYDVIHLLLARNPNGNVFRVKKKTFLEALDQLDSSYDPKLLKRISRFSAKEVKRRIRQAAQDMALDDLSSQIHLPMEKSYAVSTAAPQEDAPAVEETPEETALPRRTHWTIVQEMELLLTVARLNDQLMREFRLPLAGCRVVAADASDRVLIRLDGVSGLSLFEGQRLAIHGDDEGGSLGTCVIGLMDEESLYAEIIWNEPEGAEGLAGYHLRPLKPPEQRLLIKTRELYDRVRDDPDTLRGALRPLLGFESVAPSAQTVGTAPESLLDFSQKRAWEAAVDPANPVVAVQGPPGTGKTRVLAEVLRELCRQGLRVLVTAPSNTAVDNVCKAVTDLPVLRFGYIDKVDACIRDACWAGDGDNVDAFIKKTRSGRAGAVYAATHVRGIFDRIITRDFQERGLFDAVVFDEAGMTRMDEFLLCAAMGKRVILFGDQQQLPPFPLSDQVLKDLEKEHPHLPARTRSVIDSGALEWLRNSRQAPLILLQRTYRCQNPRLMRFSSTLFYHARVLTSDTAEYFRLPFHRRRAAYPPSTLSFYCTSALPDEVRRETVVFDEGHIGIENPCEARICRFVLLSALTRHEPEEISVISPYKRQIRRIRSLLDYEAVAPLLPRPVPKAKWETFLKDRIATVDSFQGGESDLVIISYVRSNTDGGIGFVDNPNRINVAHTRCRKELLIIGDLECLKRQARSDIFLRMERAFKRDGEIIDVDEDLLEAMPEIG
ncbi:MAG: DEAD/DEAH box helicase [Thermodesulfobacteriota bacterium]